MLAIEKQIEETDIPAIEAQLSPMPYPPYPYQFAAYAKAADAIRKYTGPFVVKAAVSAGKTTMISMLCKRIMQMKESMRCAMVLSRQPEIIEQDAEEMWNFGVNNSIFCAGLARKSAKYPIIVGSEGTVYNSLFKAALCDFSPLFLLIDECHQVDITDIINSEMAGESVDEMVAAKRKQYTIIIRELQRRSMAVHGLPLRVIGFTGTDYRGIEPIINTNFSSPGFWRSATSDISTDYLVKFGAVVPTYFGDTAGLSYDLAEFHTDGNEGVKDFTDAEMTSMQKKILQQGTLTQKIMQQVHQIAEHRNGVLVTCAGVRHCREAAAALPEGVTYAIITEETSIRDRREILKGVFTGRIKYTFQVMALTTGVNQPLWDVSVLLRRIGSLTLITQLLGRGMRKLKQSHIDAGFVKDDHLVLDYAGTMDDMSQFYFSPMMEQYQYEKAKINGETKECPACGFKDNSFYARRCINEIDGVRCEHFYTFRLCEDQKDSAGRVVVQGCGTKNDVVARTCRGCDCTLLDPNLKLSGKHYTLDDYCDVLSMEVSPGRTGNELVFKYQLEQDGHQFKAYEIFHPGSDNRGAKDAWLHNGINKHVISPAHRKEIKGIKDITALMCCKSYFMTPTRVTHRKINDGKKDVISRKEF